MSGGGSDRLPIRYTLQDYPAQPNLPQPHNRSKRHHTARYYAHRFTPSSSAVHIVDFTVALAQPSGFENAFDRSMSQIGTPTNNWNLLRLGGTEDDDDRVRYVRWGDMTVNSNRGRSSWMRGNKGRWCFVGETSVIRFKVTTWDSKHHKMHVNCDVAVGQMDRSCRLGKKKKCPVYFS
ncbi:hypothetical protein F3Y22_tig00110186pilonHSYRG00075 [Hibiscus syriacus]|uniref:Uncharacterized protein n=1 Tax=Hibiscus syriacus TaxID=106335 RepID=A0A6A3BK22_HIBSY|nr:hypothetical protein F3Y22_tig00110186pilonHSYRG00075 [Hibiscus syriacus]